VPVRPSGRNGSAGRAEMSSKQSAELPYDVFASVYDHFFGPQALPVTLEALCPLLLNQLLPGSRILDLCCGTGELTQALLQHGYAVDGIDNSAQMLRLARARLPQVCFEQADMRSFERPQHFDAVICAYNSLPHITSLPELVRVFQNVRRALVPGGTFVFDLYSEEAYLERWRGSFSQANDDFTCVVNPSYNRQTHIGNNEIRILSRQTPASESRLHLFTRCYSHQELHTSLQSAGFESIESFHADRDLRVPGAAGRVFWRCSSPPS
jgi:SAM-dependent methyltransferase